MNQLIVNTQVLVNAQFRGRFNVQAPEQLVREVEQKMIDFVNDHGFEKLSGDYRPKEVEEEMFDFGF